MYQCNSAVVSWSKEFKQFSAWASEIFRGVYPLPTVFAVKSERTGCVVRFMHRHTERDNEGDVIFWMYHSIDAPNGKVFKAKIWND